jgi:hypothetical protein
VTESPQRYDLTFRPAALRSLRKLDRQVTARIKAAIEVLRDDPRPGGVKMLTGAHGLLGSGSVTTGSFTSSMMSGASCGSLT